MYLNDLCRVHVCFTGVPINIVGANNTIAAYLYTWNDTVSYTLFAVCKFVIIGGYLLHLHIPTIGMIRSALDTRQIAMT